MYIYLFFKALFGTHCPFPILADTIVVVVFFFIKLEITKLKKPVVITYSFNYGIITLLKYINNSQKFYTFWK